ncbi:ORMDL family-domain-containing protein [Kockovaella imperatae]|uniref:ORMDL family-domain-containing protein n=1 Tax=Kockovaella imperatae TaxID=4999 RepID=A0A1Y1UI80_9TREE|nr:ORMDL family-domain-containing protein [Kockovaella imperatae]ORX37196.1 ORMDL family-domain-containing protein [Kockovaella imperatae]
MSHRPAISLTGAQPARSRSVSQPLREGVATQSFSSLATQSHPDPRTFLRSHSTQAVLRSTISGSNSSLNAPGSDATSQHPGFKGRARSSSLMTVTEVGGNETENVVDRLGVGSNENAAWVNAPGAWLIHPVLILVAKLLIDAIPGMTQDVSWTIVNLGYMAASFLMFHHVTGVPFEAALSTGGAYDDLTLWEQIDAGAQYTPAKKWLTSVPIGLFLISTHYTRYDYVLFALNFAATVFVLFPKLPVLHRLRFHFLSPDVAPTPRTSRPPSPSNQSRS